MELVSYLQGGKSAFYHSAHTICSSDKSCCYGNRDVRSTHREMQFSIISTASPGPPYPPPPKKNSHNYKLADINAKSTADSWNICGDYNYYCFGLRLKFTARNMFIGRQHLKF